MPRYGPFVFSALAALALALPLANAQSAARPWRLWAAAGVGPGLSSGEEGIAGIAQIAFQRAPHQLTIRGASVVDPFNAGCGQSFGDIAALYGRTRIRRFGHASVSSGLALTFPSSCSGINARRDGILGIPLVAEAALAAPVIGIGVQAFANFNRHGSFGGLALFIQLGWMPEG